MTKNNGSLTSIVKIADTGKEDATILNRQSHVSVIACVCVRIGVRKKGAFRMAVAVSTILRNRFFVFHFISYYLARFGLITFSLEFYDTKMVVWSVIKSSSHHNLSVIYVHFMNESIL